MEYSTLQGSCLISIIIPLNFAIGDYTLWLKKHGLKIYGVHIIVLILGAGITAFLIKTVEDPYIPFIFIGGIIVAIIQNNIISRKIVKKEEPYNNVEIILKIMEMILGIVLIVIPYTDFFNSLFLNSCIKTVCIICYVIYAIWGMEKIIFSGLSIYYERFRN